MRGEDERSGSLLSYVDREARVGGNHPLRTIGMIVNDALAALAGDFSALDSRMGRPSIRPEKLFAREARASVLFDPLGAAVDGAAGVRSFCFAGLSGSASTSGVGSLAFSKNRDRLLEGDIAAKLLSLGSGAAAGEAVAQHGSFLGRRHAEERGELESLARSTKTEHRARFKARIVLMAADGAATRAIARALGCTIGTASKWRVCFAKDRIAGFTEVGDRAARAGTVRDLVCGAGCAITLERTCRRT